MRYILKDRNLLLLFIVSFLFFLNETILLPVLPMVLHSLDYSNTEIGMTLGAFALGVVIFRPLTAYVTDNKSRKLSLLIGTAVFLIAPFLYFVSMDFTYLLCVRFFHGLGLSFFTTASPAFVSDCAPENHRAEILGHMGVASSLASVGGPMLGVLIYNAWGIHQVLWGCIALGLLGIVLTVCIREKRLPDERKPEARAYINTLRNRCVMVASGLVLVLAVMYGGIFTFLPVLVKDQFSVNVGLIFMINSLSLVIIRLLTSHFSDRYGRGPVAFYSFLILCLSYYLIGRAGTTWELIGAGILNGIGAGGCLPALIAHVVDNTDARIRGIAFSIFYGAFDIGVLMGSAALGVLADMTSLRDMYILTAMFGLIALGGFALSIQAGPVRSLKWTLAGKKFNFNNKN